MSGIRLVWAHVTRGSADVMASVRSSGHLRLMRVGPADAADEPLLGRGAASKGAAVDWRRGPPGGLVEDIGSGPANAWRARLDPVHAGAPPRPVMVMPPPTGSGTSMCPVRKISFLAAALRPDQLVVLAGPSKVGKTRTAFEGRTDP